MGKSTGHPINYTLNVKTRAGYDEHTIKRFYSKIKVDFISGCWNWTDSLDRDGYGKLKVYKQFKKAHRLSYEIHTAELTSSLICHECDNPSCVNPKHLFLGSVKDNVHDMIKKGRYKNGRVKLTQEDKLYIQNFPFKYGAIKYLAEKFQVSLTHINRIRKTV